MRLIQTQNVNLYFKTHDKKALQKPWLHIPYPNAEGLQNILEQPGIQQVLSPMISSEEVKKRMLIQG